MVKINYSDLTFDHIVVFTHEDTTFACCKENGCGKTRLFLAFGGAHNRIYTRNGRIESWELLADHDARTIRSALDQAIRAGITVYQFNGGSSIAGTIVSRNN